MRTKTKKLATLSVVRAELENLLLKSQGVEPLWQARWAERRANEARFQLALTRAFRELTKLLGTPREFVKLGKEAWQGATREQAQESVKIKLMEKLASVVEEFTHAADDAVSEAVELATKSTLSNYGLVRKQLSVREIHSELNVQLTEMVSKQLEQSFGVYANDLASIIVKATDPSKPLPMPELAKQLQSQVSGLTRKRAMLIARTESARAFGHTTYEWYKAANFSRYRWVTAAGSPAATISPVCQFCQALAAQALREIERGFEATLTVGVREPRQVTISAKYPPFHPACRCDIVADTKDWLPPRELFGPEATTTAPIGPEGSVMDFIPDFNVSDEDLPDIQAAIRQWVFVGGSTLREASLELLKNPGLLTAGEGEGIQFLWWHKNAARMLIELKRNSKYYDALYRGMHIPFKNLNEFRAAWKVGTDIEIGLSSFTPEIELATNVYAKGWPGDQAVVIEMRNARGIAFKDYVTGLSDDEVITAGKFRIVGVEERPDNVLYITTDWIGG